VLELLKGFGPEETVMLVGHEPDLSELAGALLGPGEGPKIDFKKKAR
jgi:phosphohistidine phosphatase SixA